MFLETALKRLNVMLSISQGWGGVINDIDIQFHWTPHRLHECDKTVFQMR